MSDAPTEKPQAPARPLLYPSRIIVFSLLAVALVALGFDVAARLKQRQAFAMLDAFVNEDQTNPAVAAGGVCTPSHVRTLLGRTPDAEQPAAASGELQQTYTWKGVFNRYHVHAHYGGTTLAAEKPEDAEPLLMRVEQSSNYVWQN